MPTAPVIETQALTKVFGAQRALDGVNLTVAPGAIGLLGPNGAGKSTFMKCLLQLQPTTSGSAKLLGREVGREDREIRKRVGYKGNAEILKAETLKEAQGKSRNWESRKQIGESHPKPP